MGIKGLVYRLYKKSVSVNRHYRLMKTCSVRWKRRDQYQRDNRDNNDKLNPLNTCVKKPGPS